MIQEGLRESKVMVPTLEGGTQTISEAATQTNKHSHTQTPVPLQTAATETNDEGDDSAAPTPASSVARTSPYGSVRSSRRAAYSARSTPIDSVLAASGSGRYTPLDSLNGGRQTPSAEHFGFSGSYTPLTPGRSGQVTPRAPSVELRLDFPTDGELSNRVHRVSARSVSSSHATAYGTRGSTSETPRASISGASHLFESGIGASDRSARASTTTLVSLSRATTPGRSCTLFGEDLAPARRHAERTALERSNLSALATPRFRHSATAAGSGSIIGTLDLDTSTSTSRAAAQRRAADWSSPTPQSRPVSRLSMRSAIDRPTQPHGFSKEYRKYLLARGSGGSFPERPPHSSTVSVPTAVSIATTAGASENGSLHSPRHQPALSSPTRSPVFNFKSPTSTKFGSNAFFGGPEPVLTSPVLSAHSIGLGSPPLSARGKSSRRSAREHSPSATRKLVTFAERSTPPVPHSPIIAPDRSGSPLKPLFHIIDHMVFESAPDGRRAPSPQLTPRVQSHSPRFALPENTGTPTAMPGSLMSVDDEDDHSGRSRSAQRPTFMFSARLKAISDRSNSLYGPATSREPMASPMRAIDSSTRSATESTKLTSLTPRTPRSGHELPPPVSYMPRFPRTSIDRASGSDAVNGASHTLHHCEGCDALARGEDVWPLSARSDTHDRPSHSSHQNHSSRATHMHENHERSWAPAASAAAGQWANSGSGALGVCGEQCGRGLVMHSLYSSIQGLRDEIGKYDYSLSQAHV